VSVDEQVEGGHLHRAEVAVRVDPQEPPPICRPGGEKQSGHPGARRSYPPGPTTVALSSLAGAIPGSIRQCDEWNAGLRKSAHIPWVVKPKAVSISSSRPDTPFHFGPAARPAVEPGRSSPTRGVSRRPAPSKPDTSRPRRHQQTSNPGSPPTCRRRMRPVHEVALRADEKTGPHELGLLIDAPHPQHRPPVTHRDHGKTVFVRPDRCQVDNQRSSYIVAHLRQRDLAGDADA
jgi:hypothetical protein